MLSRPVGLAGVDCLHQEVLLREQVGVAMQRSRVAGFGAGQVESHERQTETVPRLDHGSGKGQRRRSVDLRLREPLKGRVETAVVGAVAGPEHPQCAGDDPVAKGRLCAALDAVGGLMLLSHAVQAAVHGRQDACRVEVGAGVELGRQPDLDVAHALGQGCRHRVRTRRVPNASAVHSAGDVYENARR